MSEREHHGRVIRQEVRIRATPEDVYRAWADPEGIARWFVDRADGEARPGRMMTWHFDAMDMHLPVPIAEAEPGKKFVIAGQIPGRLPFVQEVLISAEGGETVLRLVNSGFREGAEWEQEYEGVDSGWTLALATLKHQLENHPGAERTHVLAVRPVNADSDAITPLFFSARGIGSWLAEDTGSSPDDLTAGSPVRLRLTGGGELEGEILARSRREILLSWPEEGAVLGLKCFALSPAKRAVGLDYSSWIRGASEAEVRARLDGALDRLVALLPVPADRSSKG